MFFQQCTQNPHMPSRDFRSVCIYFSLFFSHTPHRFKSITSWGEQMELWVCDDVYFSTCVLVCADVLACIRVCTCVCFPPRYKFALSALFEWKVHELTFVCLCAQKYHCWTWTHKQSQMLQCGRFTLWSQAFINSDLLLLLLFETDRNPQNYPEQARNIDACARVYMHISIHWSTPTGSTAATLECHSNETLQRLRTAPGAGCA